MGNSIWARNLANQCKTFLTSHGQAMQLLSHRLRHILRAASVASRRETVLVGMAFWCAPACRVPTFLHLQLQQRMLTAAKEAARQASTHSLIGKRRISRFSMLSASLPMARPLSNRLQSTIDDRSAMEMIDDESSSIA